MNWQTLVLAACCIELVAALTLNETDLVALDNDAIDPTPSQQKNVRMVYFVSVMCMDKQNGQPIMSHPNVTHELPPSNKPPPAAEQNQVTYNLGNTGNVAGNAPFIMGKLPNAIPPQNILNHPQEQQPAHVEPSVIGNVPVETGSSSGKSCPHVPTVLGLALVSIAVVLLDWTGTLTRRIS